MSRGPQTICSGLFLARIGHYICEPTRDEETSKRHSDDARLHGSYSYMKHGLTLPPAFSCRGDEIQPWIRLPTNLSGGASASTSCVWYAALLSASTSSSSSPSASRVPHVKMEVDVVSVSTWRDWPRGHTPPTRHGLARGEHSPCCRQGGGVEEGGGDVGRDLRRPRLR
jgi:hypothetical protein